MTRPDVKPPGPARTLLARVRQMIEPLEAESIREAARALTPEIEARADEAASLRRMPTDLVARLQAAGVFRLAVPRSRGGPQMSAREQMEIVELLSTADPSAGWCVRAGSVGGFLSARLADDAANELFPTPDTITAGDLTLGGRAQRVRGGYRVSGRWGSASGCTHAAVLFAHCPVFEGDASVMAGSPGAGDTSPRRPETRIVIAPSGRWQILDTWYTTGLAGSGSHDFTAHDLFIPEAHALDPAAPARTADALYASEDLVPAALAGVPLGLARRAIDSLRALLEGRSTEDSSIPVTLETAPIALEAVPLGLEAPPGVRAALARGESTLGAARAYAYEALDAAWLRLRSGNPLTRDLRLALSLSRLHAFRAGREVAQLMFNAAGSTAVYTRSPLDRLLRDAITIAQHAAAHDRNLETIGGALLAKDAPLPVI